MITTPNKNYKYYFNKNFKYNNEIIITLNKKFNQIIIIISNNNSKYYFIIINLEVLKI